MGNSLVPNALARVYFGTTNSYIASTIILAQNRLRPIVSSPFTAAIVASLRTYKFTRKSASTPDIACRVALVTLRCTLVKRLSLFRYASHWVFNGNREFL